MMTAVGGCWRGLASKQHSTSESDTITAECPPRANTDVCGLDSWVAETKASDAGP